MAKSSRHSKICGDFGEALVLYWLSKTGFECAMVDHTGIDLIATNPTNKEMYGISVKCRTRLNGTENDHVKIGDIEKIKKACVDFGKLTPYLAIVVEAGSSIKIFMTPLERAMELSRYGWQMSPKFISRYDNDEKVMSFQLEIKQSRWWPSKNNFEAE